MFLKDIEYTYIYIDNYIVFDYVWNYALHMFPISTHLWTHYV